jgi:hypothetical protein
MKSSQLQKTNLLIMKPMLNKIKRNLGLMPNSHILDKISHAKKISKQKLDLRRVQTKQRLNEIRCDPQSSFTPLLEPIE